MATFAVTTINDISDAGDGLLSLREAIAQANATAAADTIVFANGIEGQTLVLTNGELAITKDLTIDGDKNGDGTGVTISGNDASRIMTISGDQTDVALTDLVFRDGRANGDDGGAVNFDGRSLSVTNSTFVSNTSNTTVAGDYKGDGGAIFLAGGDVRIADSLFEDNFSLNGGAIATAFSDIDLKISSSRFLSNDSAIGGGAMSVSGYLSLVASEISHNRGGYYHSGGTGGIRLHGSGVIDGTTINNNFGKYGAGGVEFSGSALTINNSTVASNTSGGGYAAGRGGGIAADSGNLVIRSTTVTANAAGDGFDYDSSKGGGIFVSAGAALDIANSIVAGNRVDGPVASGADIEGSISFSNGHNIFGSDITGAIAGDRELIDPAAVFADINPDTGGGMVNDDGIVQLLDDVANPALGGADRFASSSTDQLGIHRPTPSLTNPDIGAAESGFVPSHVTSLNNDSIIGNGGANVLNGLAGDDFLKGLASKDTLNGGDGNDFLEGNGGKDRLNGGAGIDIANFGDSNKSVRVDLRGDGPGDTDTARRGDGNDTLTGIDGAIAGGGRDRFWGDGGDNWIQGGGGKDTFTGGGGSDLYDYNLTSASPTGSGRDVITDFRHLTDDIDLMGIDADTTVAGNQAFRWVGSAALTGPGEVGFFTSGGNTIVRMSTDADAASEGEIQLTGIKTLTALDFYL